MDVLRFNLPEVRFSAFSGSICKLLTEDEEKWVKNNMVTFLSLNGGEVVTWFNEPTANPIVRASSMKILFALFESDSYTAQAEGHLDRAVTLIVNHAKLPSEIDEGLAFLRKFLVKNPLPRQESGVEEGAIRVHIASSLVGLLEKLAEFEICDAKLGKEKKDTARAMICLLLKKPSVPNISEHIISCLRQICSTDNGEMDVDLIYKEDEHYFQRAIAYNDDNNFGIQGPGGDVTKMDFNKKWFGSAGRFRYECRIDKQSDWICVVELLNRFLNTTILEHKDYNIDMFGRDRNQSEIMVKIDPLRSVISVRARTKDLCDHAVKMLEEVKLKIAKLSH